MNARLMLIATGGGDWDKLRRLIAAGRLPTLRHLVARGTAGTLDMRFQGGAAFWATVATGQPPAAHGITAPIEARPDGGGFQPIGASSWRAPPVWKVLSQAGIATATIGWPTTAPAVAWPGIAVDPRFLTLPPTSAPDWPLPPRCISPMRLRTPLRNLRVHPSALNPEASAASDPSALAAAASVHAAVTYVAQREPYQLLMAHYGALLQLNDGAAEVFDAMLARLLMLAGPETDVMLVGAKGMFVAAGPGFMANARIQRVNALQIAPTILCRFGFASKVLEKSPIAGTRHADLTPVS